VLAISGGAERLRQRHSVGIQSCVTSSEPFSARQLSRKNGLLYQQLLAILREPIVNESLAVGTVLPTESALAERFGVSLITVRQALRELEREGLIRKRAAKAAVVSSPQPNLGPSWDLNSFADFVANTRDGRLELRSYRKERSALAQEAFRLSARESCYCLRGVLALREQLVSQITIFFPPEIGKRLSMADFDDVVIFRSVQRHLGMQMAGARITLRAELADEETARDLDYIVGEPILTMQMLYRTTDGQPVELTIAKHRADRFSITYDLPNTG
jgi:GntR family transcriptional regulator